MVDRSRSEKQVPTDDQTDAPNPLDLGLERIDTPPDDQGISLDELSQAYAQLIGKGDDPYEPDDPAPAPSDAEEIVDELDESEENDSCELCPKSIVEAILFVGHPQNDPIDSQRLASLMRGVPPQEIDEIVAELNDEYREHEHPFHIVSPGFGYRLELRDDFSSLRNVFYGRVREARLSQAAVDVLAIVAYQQGRSRTQIDNVRGRPSGALLSQLVRRRLLRIERPDAKPRTPQYFTTDRFLELFGLAGLDELPQSHEVE